MREKLWVWFEGTSVGKWSLCKSLNKWIGAAVALGTLAICLSITSWALAYQHSLRTEKPSAADWLQGWGTIFGLIATSIAAVVAAAVYIESRRAAELSEQRRLEDRDEAEKAAEAAEKRYQQERHDAAAATATAEQQRRDEVNAAQRAARVAETQLWEEREHRQNERRQAQLAQPRSVLSIRVAVNMAGSGQASAVIVTVQNFGTQPIRLVRCFVKIKDVDEEVGMQVPYIGPAELTEISWHATGGKHLTVPLREVPAWYFDNESDFWTVRVKFLDATGQAWERVNNGEPVEVESTMP